MHFRIFSIIILASAGLAAQRADGVAQTLNCGGEASVEIHGSNTIGATLMPSILQKFAEARGWRIAQTSPALEEKVICFFDGDKPMGGVRLASHGSGTAFKGLLSGMADIGMSSRRIEQSEADALKAKFSIVMKSESSEHVIALDGLSIIVNQSNPIKEKTFPLQTISQIFSGDLMDWRNVGEHNGRIRLHARDDKSGTYDFFNGLLLKSVDRKLASWSERHESSQVLSKLVAQEAESIGFIGVTYIGGNAPLALAYPPCNLSYRPTRLAIQTEVYPLSRRLYLYTPGAPKKKLAQEILAFSLSDKAQSAVREAGFIDQSIMLEDEQAQNEWRKNLTGIAVPGAPKRAVDSLMQAIRPVRRASLNLRFNVNSIQLDVKAQEDVRRFARWMKSAQMKGKRFLIAGFADSGGSWEKNYALALERARAVGEALRREGMKISEDQYRSFGWLAPVACNEAQEGKALNRRVELWIQG